MIKGIYFIADNMGAKQKNMDIVANNLANINTTGYKRELPFSEIITRYKDTPLKQLTDYSQGNLIETHNPLDLAVSGDVYFSLKTANGMEYTKNGRFRISNDGFLVNEQGDKVMGRKGEINFNNYTLDSKATISVSKKGEIQVGDSVVDDLLITKVDNSLQLDRKQGLNFESDNNAVTEASEDEFELQQGYLEESNTNAIFEMQAMIDINKDFETSQKMMNFLDSSLEKATEIGRV